MTDHDHRITQVTDTLFRCACGSEFRTEDDAELHAMNAREAQALREARHAARRANRTP
jgi:hypothetical protein